MTRFLKRLGLIALTSLPLFAATPSLADSFYNDGWYGGITGDATWIDDSTGAGTGGGGYLELGRTLTPNSDFGNARLETEVGYHDIDGNHDFSYMGNLYYDVNGMTFGLLKVGPYFGAGVGAATLHYGLSDAFGPYVDHGTVFAYQFMAGLNFISQTMPNTTWVVGYRYVGSSDVDGSDNAGNSSQVHLDDSNFEFGLRYTF